MLKKIKSFVILKLIFSHNDSSRKIKLVLYNKKFRNKLNINLIDIRRASGKYRVINETGNIQEFSSYNDQLIYEGEYSKGEKNGKGI